MAVKENSIGLLSRVASLIRKDDKSSDSERDSRPDLGAETTQQALKARVEQKRRDDIIRRREFDYLRKIRSNGIVTSSYVAGRSQVFQSSGGYQEQERHNTVQKINDIEAQMSRNWWVRKSEELGVPLPPTRPAPLATPKPAPKPVIASVRMGGVDAPPAPEGDLLDGFEFATAPTIPAPLAPTPSATSNVQDRNASLPNPDPVVIGFVASVSSTLESSLSEFSNSKLISIEMGATLGDPHLQEAAIRFAEGDAPAALALLEQGFHAHDARPEALQIYAGAIFDLHRATGSREAFDGFALAYAERFGTSPPEWVNLPELVRALRAQREVPAAELRSNEWACPATLTAQALQSLHKVVQSTTGTVHVHWDALRELDNAVAQPFAKLMADWASHPVKLSFSGAPVLLKALKARTPGGDVRTDQTWWQLRLQALRVMGLLDEFEQVALDFCMVYELSPPSWEVPDCECTHEMEVHAPSSFLESSMSEFDGQRGSVFGLLTSHEAEVVTLEGDVLGDADAALAGLRDSTRGSQQLVVNCSHLIRVDFAAAGSILNWVANLESQGCHVQFQDLSRLVAAFFNVIGINDHASVVLRSR